ncbi:hypothetical protein M3Y94_00689800 [Aphelenchoides besseyi]|nr:hypothetical protein M3Y94_00689800 [Aphelenchoides besseyi]
MIGPRRKRNYKQPTAMDSMITAVRLQAVNDETTEQPQQATRRLQTARKTVTYPGTPNPTATIGSSTKPVEPFAQAANKLYNELKAAKRFVLADSLEHQIAEITDVFKRHLNVGEAAVCEQNGRQPSNGLVSADSQLTMSMLEERLKNQEQWKKKRRRSATTNTASETQTVPPQQAPASHQLLGREQVFGPQHVNYSAVQQRMMPIPSTQPRLSHGQMIPNQNPTLPSLFPSHRMFTRLPMPTQQPTFIDSSRQQMSFQQPNQPTNQPTVPYNHPSHQFNATGYSFVPQSVPQSQPQLHPQYHSAPTFAMIANAVRTQNAQNPANSPLPNTHYHHCIGPIKSANGNKISGLSTMSQPTCSQQPQSSGSNSSVPKTTSSMKTDDMSDESNDSFYHVEDE